MSPNRPYKIYRNIPGPSRSRLLYKYRDVIIIFDKSDYVKVKLNLRNVNDARFSDPLILN